MSYDVHTLIAMMISDFCPITDEMTLINDEDKVDRLINDTKCCA